MLIGLSFYQPQNGFTNKGWYVCEAILWSVEREHRKVVQPLYRSSETQRFERSDAIDIYATEYIRFLPGIVIYMYVFVLAA